MSSIQAGDVVVCADDAPRRDPWMRPYSGSLKLGRAYRVAAVGWSDDWLDGPGYVLDVVGAPCPTGHDDLPDGWDANRFRKVQKADDSFIRKIKACRPKHDRVPHNVESDRG